MEIVTGNLWKNYYFYTYSYSKGISIGDNMKIFYRCHDIVYIVIWNRSTSKVLT